MVLIFVVLIRFITEIFSVFMLIHHLALMLRGGGGYWYVPHLVL